MIKTATVHEIKKELQHLNQEQLVELCLRLANFKKDNKELLAHLLFETQDEGIFIEQAKMQIDDYFNRIETGRNFFIVKKQLRSALSVTKKLIKISSNKLTEIQLLLHFCRNCKVYHIPLEKHPVIENISFVQVKKIRTIILSLHEDLQSDYTRELDLILSQE